MPSTLSVDHFLRQLELSGILPAEDVSAVLRIVDIDEASYPTAESLSEYLVNAGMLTQWQAEKLLDGKHKGFTLGNYVLKDMLGQGAMGTVYLAEQMLMKRRCAVKLLHPTRLKDPELLERFLREGRAVATTDHPNIVRAYELSRIREGSTDLYFLAMELATGRNLQDVVETDGTFTSKRVAHILRQVALGLAHAHQKGLIHRDIKPTNLMLDDNGIIKILDLGLARFFDDSDDSRLSSLHDSTFLGTAGYLAPEQAYNSRDVDARADLYSVGATGFYLLCGRPPFNEGTVVRRLMESQSQQPPHPRDIKPDIAEELDQIVVRLLQPVASDRFQSADELIDALDDWLRTIPGGEEDSSKFRRPREEPTTDFDGTAKLSADKTNAFGGSKSDREDSKPSVPVAVLIPSDSTVTRNPELQAAIRNDLTFPRHGLRWLLIGVALTLLCCGLAFSVWRAVRRSPELPDVIGSKQEAGRSGSGGATTPTLSGDNKVVAPQPTIGHSAATVQTPKNRSVTESKDPTDALAAFAKTEQSQYERQIAVADAGGELPGLVGVIGDSRLKHFGRVRRVAFSESDGVVASLGNDGAVRIWKLETGEQLQAISLSQTSSPNSLAVVSNGTRVLVGFSDGAVTSFETKTGTSSWTRKLDESEVVDLVATNQGESVWTACANSQHLVQLNVSTGETIKTVSVADKVKRLKVNADSTQLGVALRSAIEVYGIESGELIARLTGFQYAAAALDFSPNSKQVVGAFAEERELGVWDIERPDAPLRLPMKDEANAVAFLPDGLRLLAANGWGLQTIELSKPESPRSLYGHFGSLRDIVVNAKLKLAATVGDDHQVALWQLPTLQRRFVNDPPAQSLKEMSVDPQGRWIVVGDYGRARLWDVASNRLLHEFGPYQSALDELTISPNGEQVAAANIFDPEVRIWSTESGKELARVAMPEKVTGLSYRHDSKQLACSYRSRSGMGRLGIMLIDAETRAVVRELATPKESNANAKLEWSGDGMRLLSCEARSVALWDVETGRTIKRLKIDNLKIPRFRASALNPSGQRAFVATYDGRVLECNFETDDVRNFYVHERGNWVDSLCLSPDGTSLLMSTRDGTLRTKSLDADVQQPTRDVRVGPTRGTIGRVVFSKDGRHIITGNANGTVYVLKVADLNWK